MTAGHIDVAGRRSGRRQATIAQAPTTMTVRNSEKTRNWGTSVPPVPPPPAITR